LREIDKREELLIMENQYPKSIKEAVELLSSELSEKDKQAIGSIPEHGLSSLHLSLGNYIRNEFGLWGNNEELLKACCPDISLRNADDASVVIIEALWWALQPIQ
jgi:hypothetical protein